MTAHEDIMKKADCLMSQLSTHEEVLRRIGYLRDVLDKYHEEMKGSSFSKAGLCTDRMETFHFADYTGAAIDALSDLQGVMEGYYDEN